MATEKQKHRAKRAGVARHEAAPEGEPATRREILIIMGMTGCSYGTAQRVLRDEPVKSEGTKQIVLRAFDWVRKNRPTLRLAVQP